MGLEARQCLELMNACKIGDKVLDERMPVQVVLPLLAAGLATMAAYDSTSSSDSPDSLDISALIALAPSPPAIKYAGSFLSTVVRHCVQVTRADDGFSLMQTIFAYLDNAPVQAGQHVNGRSVLHKIKVAAAFSLCDDSCRPDKLEWAMSVNQTLSPAKDATLITTPARIASIHNDGYRWEEGISEWIKRTPTASKLESVHSPTQDSKCNSIATPLLISIPDRRVQHLSNTTAKEEGAGRDSELAKMLMNSSGRTTRPRTRHEPAIGTGTDLLASSLRPLALNTFQNIEVSSEDDLDELSIPDAPLHRDWSQQEGASLEQPRPRRQKPIVCMTGLCRGARPKQICTEETPTWIKKRTSLGLKVDAEGMVDELALQ